MKPGKRTLWGIGSAIGYVILERMEFPVWVAGPLGLVAVGCFAAGLWQWAGEFNHQQPRGRRGEQKRLQIVLSGLFVTTCVLGFLGLRGLIPTSSNETTEMLERYRRLFAISDIPNKTSLIELNNRELKAKATAVYQRIRDMEEVWNAEHQRIRSQLQSGAIDQATHDELVKEQRERFTNEYAREHRVDARMVLTELYNRIPPKARKHLMGLPGITDNDPRSGIVSMYDIMPPEVSIYFSDQLANQIEELVKLLPDRQ